MPIYARPHDIVQHVWSGDPALDTSDVKRFTEAFTKCLSLTGKWEDVPCKPGEKPVLWQLRPLRHEHRIRLSDDMVGRMAQAEILAQQTDEPFSMSAKDLIYTACARRVELGLVGAHGFLERDGRPVEFPQTHDRLSAETMNKLSLIHI